MVAVEYFPYVSSVFRIGQVDVFRQMLFVRIEQVVDTAHPHPGGNIVGQVEADQPDSVFLYWQRYGSGPGRSRGAFFQTLWY